MKKLLIIFSVLTIMLSMVACNFSVPKAINVKANPKFTIATGAQKINLSETLSSDKIKTMVGNDNDSLIVVNYRKDANDNNLQYLIKYPIASVPLDFGQYMDSLDFADSFSANFPTQEFSIPEIKGSTSTINIGITGGGFQADGEFSDSCRVQA